MTHPFFLMAPPDAGSEGAIMNFVFLGALFLVFYFFIIRPQSKKQKETQQKIASIKKGDKIVTSGGIIAIVHSIEDATLLAEVDSGVKVRFLKNSVTDVNPTLSAEKS